MSGTVSIPNNIPSSNWPFPNFGRLAIPAPDAPPASLPQPIQTGASPQATLSIADVGRPITLPFSPPAFAVPNLTFLPELGRGGQGRVYLLHTPDGNYAVKKMDPSMSGREITAAKHFAKNPVLNMPGVVFVDEARSIVVYELAPGKNLSYLLAGGTRLSPRESAQITLGVAKALEGIAEQGGVHRDVKPSNIKVKFLPWEPPQVTLLDLGLLTFEGVKPGARTFTGTPHYAAPEQFYGGRHVTPKTDVYGLGKVLFEALTREDFHPLRGDIQGDFPKEFSWLDERVKGRGDAAVSFHSRLQKAPPQFRPLLAKMLHLFPGVRPTASDVVRYLEIYLDPSLAPPGEIRDPILRALVEPGVPADFPPPLSNAQAMVSRSETPTTITRVRLVTGLPSRAARFGVGVGGLAIPFFASMGTVAGLQALGVDPNEHSLALNAAGFGAAHVAYLAYHRLATGGLPTFPEQAGGLTNVIVGGEIAKFFYKWGLDDLGVDGNSAARSPIAETAVSIGGGLGFAGYVAPVVNSSAAAGSVTLKTGASAAGPAAALGVHLIVLDWLIKHLDTLMHGQRPTA